ncbi:unnamed protein product [Ilex paraguariensis]|uniref:Cytochrome c biogenesis B n=1 Tax=Ilex paraguariensis TaxID=185542 RepID=A0ABC8SA93_9AQUA
MHPRYYSSFSSISRSSVSFQISLGSFFGFLRDSVSSESIHLPNNGTINMSPEFSYQESSLIRLLPFTDQIWLIIFLIRTLTRLDCSQLNGGFSSIAASLSACSPAHASWEFGLLSSSQWDSSALPSAQWQIAHNSPLTSF